MELAELKRIFDDTDWVRRSGTPEELRAAEYLKGRCEAFGVPARLEAFPVPMGEIEEAEVLADGRSVPCRGLSCCGSGSVEGELYYMPGQDPVSIAGAKDRIVLLDNQGVDHFVYQDLMKAGARGILFQSGSLHTPDRDIEERDLRALVVGGGTEGPERHAPRRDGPAACEDRGENRPHHYEAAGIRGAVPQRDRRIAGQTGGVDHPHRPL